MTIKPRYVALIIGILLVVLIAVTTYRHSNASRAVVDPNAPSFPPGTGDTK